jgi:hypothetical protein
VDKIFPFDNAADAIRYLEVEHARAKVVIDFFLIATPVTDAVGVPELVRERKGVGTQTRQTP